MIRSRQTGFTLIELLVVLVIMSLMTALATPLLSGFQAGAAMRGAARDVANALRSTRDQAIQRGAATDFAIDLDAGNFRAGSGPVRHIPGGIKLSLVTTSNEQFNQTAGAIRFFADGSSTGGAVALDQASRHDVVRVDWVTGRVSSGKRR